MTLDSVTRPVETIPPRVVVFGRPMTREDALALSAELHYRKDYEAGLRVLSEAGLTIHDLVEWADPARGERCER